MYMIDFSKNSENFDKYIILKKYRLSVLYKERFLNSQIKCDTGFLSSMIVWKIILINKNHIIKIKLKGHESPSVILAAANGKLSNVLLKLITNKKSV